MNKIVEKINKIKKINEEVLKELKEINLYEFYFRYNDKFNINLSSEELKEFLLNYNDEDSQSNSKLLLLLIKDYHSYGEYVKNFLRRIVKNLDYDYINSENRIFSLLDIKKSKNYFSQYEVEEYGNIIYDIIGKCDINIKNENGNNFIMALVDENSQIFEDKISNKMSQKIISEIIRKTDFRIKNEDGENFLNLFFENLKDRKINFSILNLINQEVLNYIINKSDLNESNKEGNNVLMTLLNYANSSKKINPKELNFDFLTTFNLLLSKTDLSHVDKNGENILVKSLKVSSLPREVISFLVENCDVKCKDIENKSCFELFIENYWNLSYKNFKHLLYNSAYDKENKVFNICSKKMFDSNKEYLNEITENDKEFILKFYDKKKESLYYAIKNMNLNKEQINYLIKNTDFKNDKDLYSFEDFVSKEKLTTNQLLYLVKKQKGINNYHIEKNVIERNDKNIDKKIVNYFKIRKFLENSLKINKTISNLFLSILYPTNLEFNIKDKVLFIDENNNIIKIEKEEEIDLQNLGNYDLPNEELILLKKVNSLINNEELTSHDNYKNDINTISSKTKDVLKTYLRISKGNVEKETLKSADELLKKSLNNIYQNLLFIQKEIIEEQLNKLKVLERTTESKLLNQIEKNGNNKI